jgi:hypothetical protein
MLLALPLFNFGVRRAYSSDTVDGVGDLLDKAAVHHLVSAQGLAAVRALCLLFGQPAADTGFAAQFGAVRTHHGIFNFVKADETLEDLVQVRTFFTLLCCSFSPSGPVGGVFTA